jgi:hypothetical protein
MFNRYAWPAKRAIFYARTITVLSERNRIDSVDLLRGLSWGDDSRAQTIFKLREYFPLYQGSPWKVANLVKPKQEPALDDPCKMILAWTSAEATRMGDYWIDTEHLLLGILRVRSCVAAQYLEMTGLHLRAARETIRASKSSRPCYGPVPRLWPITSRLRTVMSWGWP